MPSKAQVTIIGHVGQTPEFKYTSGGSAVLSLSVATNKYRYQGEPATTWWDVSLFGARAETLNNHDLIHKGSLICVLGEPFVDKWTGQDGQERQSLKVVATDIVVLEGRRNDAQADQGHGFVDSPPNVGDIPF